MAIYPPTHNPRIIFGMVKGTGNMFRHTLWDHTNNKVRRFCVGGDIVILVFGSFQKFGGFYTDPIFKVTTTNK